MNLWANIEQQSKQKKNGNVFFVCRYIRSNWADSDPLSNDIFFGVYVSWFYSMLRKLETTKSDKKKEGLCKN